MVRWLFKAFNFRDTSLEVGTRHFDQPSYLWEPTVQTSVLSSVAMVNSGRLTFVVAFMLIPGSLHFRLVSYIV